MRLALGRPRRCKRARNLGLLGETFTLEYQHVVLHFFKSLPGPARPDPSHQACSGLPPARLSQTPPELAALCFVPAVSPPTPSQDGPSLFSNCRGLQG